MKTLFLLGTVLIIFIIISTSDQTSLEILTHQQKIILDNFKSHILIDKLPHQYMKTELYLVRWLRAKDWNIDAARKALDQNIRWRRENKIDSILSEDWSDFESRYRVEIEGCDKEEGRPVIYIPLDSWDLRGAVIGGQAKKLMRYTEKLFEEGDILIRRLHEETPHNVTQRIDILDLKGFNYRMHGCGQCIAIISHLIQTADAYYPLSVHKSFIINTPPLFRSFFQILRPLLSKEMQNAVLLFGRNRREWEEEILKEVDPSNLSQELGGWKEEVWNFEELRHNLDSYQCNQLG